MDLGKFWNAGWLMQEVCVTLCHLFVPRKKIRLRKSFLKCLCLLSLMAPPGLFTIVLHFVLEGKIVQKLVKLQMLAKQMNAGEPAHEVISDVQVTY